MRHRLFGIIVIFYAISTPLMAKELRERVIALDGQTVQLAHTGKAQFADLLFPDAALADAWLAQHVLQQELTFTASHEDRYGRMLIHADQQEAMLRAGVALIFNQQEIPASWLAAEQSARRDKRGVWANEGVILTPEQTEQHRLEFHLVEGVVAKVHRARNATYINFGDDWHTDFSVIITGRNRRSFDAVLARIQQGTRVRVRGAIYEENGPMMRLTRPEMLEII